MNLRISAVVTAFALATILGNAQCFAQNAYITNSSSNTVSVIDTATNTVTATVDVGFFPYGVAVSPDGSKVYVTNRGSGTESGTVSVIGTATNTLIATVPVGLSPFGVAVSPDGSKVYVTNSAFFTPSGTVSVIDTATNTVIATVAVGRRPFGVAVTPDGRKVYVTNSFPGAGVSVIDTATDTVIASIVVEGSPEGVAVAPDGSKVYVAASRNGPAAATVPVIDTATDTVIATIFTGLSFPSTAVAVSPDGSKVYVTNGGAAGVSVIDTATNTTITTIGGVGFGITGVSVTPDGSKVYVAGASNDVKVIATATNTVTTTIPVGLGPRAFGIFIQPAPNARELVNDKVSFEPLASTFQITSDTTGCPAGFTGIFSFTARLTNSSENLLTNLVVDVTTLTNDNLLQNADGGPAGVGARLTVPRQDGFSDGVLHPEDFVDVPFIICLKEQLPFTFLVDVFGRSER